MKRVKIRIEGGGAVEMSAQLAKVLQLKPICVVCGGTMNCEFCPRV